MTPRVLGETQRAELVDLKLRVAALGEKAVLANAAAQAAQSEFNRALFAARIDCNASDRHEVDLRTGEWQEAPGAPPAPSAPSSPAPLFPARGKRRR